MGRSGLLPLSITANNHNITVQSLSSAALCSDGSDGSTSQPHTAHEHCRISLYL